MIKPANIGRGPSFGRYATPVEIKQFAFYDNKKPEQFMPKLCFVAANDAEELDDRCKAFWNKIWNFPFSLFYHGFHATEDYMRIAVPESLRRHEKENEASNTDSH